MCKKGRRWQEVAGGQKSHLLPRNVMSYNALSDWQEVAGGPLSQLYKNMHYTTCVTCIYKVGAVDLLLPPAGRRFFFLNDFLSAGCGGRRSRFFGRPTSCRPPATSCRPPACLLPAAGRRRRVPSVPVVEFAGLGSTGSDSSRRLRLGDGRAASPACSRRHNLSGTHSKTLGHRKIVCACAWRLAASCRPPCSFAERNSEEVGNAKGWRLSEDRRAPASRPHLHLLSRLLGRAQRRHAAAGASASLHVITSAGSPHEVGVAS